MRHLLVFVSGTFLLTPVALRSQYVDVSPSQLNDFLTNSDNPGNKFCSDRYSASSRVMGQGLQMGQMDVCESGTYNCSRDISHTILEAVSGGSSLGSLRHQV
jgi:hypothetical protein